MLKNSLAVIVMALFFSPAMGMKDEDPDITQLLEMDIEDLSNVRVFTASRNMTSIESAPSVITLITADEIERQGLKNLHEVLARVPGFFNATSMFMDPLSNRGFSQNVNTNYLLLVDGHSLNNDAINGVGHLGMLPGLDRIQRIEVIRGPGATLWGASAAMGIIHMITKNAAGLDHGKPRSVVLPPVTITNSRSSAISRKGPTPKNSTTVKSRCSASFSPAMPNGRPVLNLDRTILRSGPIFK